MASPLRPPPDAEDKLRDIRSVTDAALSHLDADDLLAELLGRVKEILDADTVAVLLLDSVPQALQAGVASITKVMQSRIEIGRMTPADLVAALGRLSTTGTLQAMADRDVVIEAIIEKEESKVQVYRELQPLLPPGAILASNTSTISITRMAGALQKPGRFAGMHFFNPADRMPLVEVIRGEKTDDATVVTLYLSNSINIRLRGILQKQLKPGTRIVSHRFTFGDWKPEAEQHLEGTSIYLWTIR